MGLLGFAVTLLPVVDDKAVLVTHVYVTAPLAVRVIGVPAHCTKDVGAMDTVGRGFTVIGIVAAVVQPLLVEPTTVYVVDIVGDALTVAPVCDDSPFAGVQEYVTALMAVNMVDPPMHIAPSVALTDVGGLTDTGNSDVAVQPKPVVPVTE